MPVSVEFLHLGILQISVQASTISDTIGHVIDDVISESVLVYLKIEEVADVFKDCVAYTVKQLLSAAKDNWAENLV